jgi:hypothetical protein
VNQRTEEGLRKAVDFFEKAIVEDPSTRSPTAASPTCQDRAFDLIHLKVDPRFDPLRGDKRFDSIARQLGVE